MILYGARGHAKVVYDLILSNNHLLEYLVDDQPHDEFPHRLNIYKPTRELIKYTIRLKTGASLKPFIIRALLFPVFRR